MRIIERDNFCPLAEHNMFDALWGNLPTNVDDIKQVTNQRRPSIESSTLSCPTRSLSWVRRLFQCQAQVVVKSDYDHARATNFLLISNQHSPMPIKCLKHALLNSRTHRVLSSSTQHFLKLLIKSPYSKSVCLMHSTMQ